MVKVTTANGRVYTNEDIPSWNSFNPRSPIVSITLTDGHKMQASLRNCSFYVYEIEKLSGYSFCGGGLRDIIISETVYGYHNIDKAVKELEEAYSKQLMQIGSAVLEDKQQALIDRANRAYKEMLQKLEDKSVQVISLGLNLSGAAKSYKSFNEAALKPGQEPEISAVSILGARFHKRL